MIKHNESSKDCWCEPEIIVEEFGDIIVHKGVVTERSPKKADDFKEDTP